MNRCPRSRSRSLLGERTRNRKRRRPLAVLRLLPYTLASPSGTRSRARGGSLGPIHLHPRPLLPAAAREPLAGHGGAAGLGLSLSRLERAHHRGVLRPQRRRPHPGARWPHRPAGEQLRPAQLRRRPVAPALAARAGARRLPGDARRRPRQPAALRRARLRPGPAGPSRHPAPGQPGRPGHGGRLGHPHLRARLRPRARRDVAAGVRRGRAHPGGAGRPRHSLHHPVGGAGGTYPAARQRNLAGRRRGPHRPVEGLPEAPALGAVHRPLLHPRRHRARGVLGTTADQRRGAGAAAAVGLPRGARGASARPRRQRRRGLRPPPPPRRHGPGLRPVPPRSRRVGSAHQLRRLP